MLPLTRAHVRSVHRQIMDQVIPSIAAYAPAESFPHVTFSSTANSVSGVLNLTLDVDTDHFTVPEAPRQHFSSYSVHLGLLSVIEYSTSDCSGFNKTFSPDSCSGFQKYDVAYADWSQFAPHSGPSQYGFIPYVSTIDIPSKGTLSVTYISSPVKAQFQNITLEDDTVYLFVNITSWTYSSGNELLAFKMDMVGEFVSGSATVNQTQLTSIYNATGSTRPAAEEFIHIGNVISSSQGTASFLLQPRPPTTNFSLFTLPTCTVPECSLWDANATKNLVYYSMVSPGQSDFTWVVTLDSATPVTEVVPPPSLPFVPPPRSSDNSDETTLAFEILFAFVAFAAVAMFFYCWVLRRRLEAVMKASTSAAAVPLELQSSSEYRRFQEE
ncbi:putative mitochondrial protein [Andalucia godoyi]|uniref:Putative mitochondrial protein n=1 Tax=Andalucia godoyi TaxID=505711 RepID=A0A8K0AGL5_ANDGO|nr:putative mitochondrial protein [Andalucia godoyi]|eukprot:ANDGO_00536.mRNA.1 putative mitochondrial protein